MLILLNLVGYNGTVGRKEIALLQAKYRRIESHGGGYAAYLAYSSRQGSIDLQEWRQSTRPRDTPRAEDPAFAYVY